MLEEARIIEIAKEAGVDLGMYPPLKMVDAGDGVHLKFVRPNELTIYGERILSFARMIELDVLRSNAALSGWPGKDKTETEK